MPTPATRAQERRPRDHAAERHNVIPDAESLLAMYRRMALIRQFENRILELFSKGELNGTTHTYVGQEANAVGLISQLRDTDVVFSSHRCHGHYLARFGDSAALFGELMGRTNGVCAGRGGSQHLCRDNFYSNGIQGGYVPIAAGMAYAEKKAGTDAIVTAFIGDGTLGEGAVYEGANLASLWQVPLLIVVENNRYAQTTPIDLALAGEIGARFAAFGFTVSETESNDIIDLNPLCAESIDRVRSDQRPHALILNTYRLNAHSKGDDFRDLDEIAQWRKKDPLTLLSRYLDDKHCVIVDQEVSAELVAAERKARSAPEATG